MGFTGSCTSCSCSFSRTRNEERGNVSDNYARRVRKQHFLTSSVLVLQKRVHKKEGILHGSVVGARRRDDAARTQRRRGRPIIRDRRRRLDTSAAASVLPVVGAAPSPVASR